MRWLLAAGLLGCVAGCSFEEGSFFMDGSVVDTRPVDAAFTCDDDRYDVDGMVANGCEVSDTMSIHTVATAANLGVVSECNATGPPVTFTNTFPSDARTHLPSGFYGAIGRADFIKATHLDDGLCINDPTIALELTGGVGMYEVTLIRGDGQPDTACTSVPVAGGSSVTKTCSDQMDGETIVIEIEKLSGPAEAPSYTLTYHN